MRLITGFVPHVASISLVCISMQYVQIMCGPQMVSLLKDEGTGVFMGGICSTRYDGRHLPVA